MTLRIMLTLVVCLAAVGTADFDKSLFRQVRNPDYLSFQPLVVPGMPAKDTLVESIDQNYDADLGQWVNEARTLFSYDENFRLVREVTELYFDPEWTKDSLSAYTYDAQGNIRENTILRWNIGTSTWTTDIRTSNTYDASGQITQAINQGWWADTWNNVTRTLTYYDAQGVDTLVMNQRWAADRWEDASRVRNTIDLVERSLHGTTQIFNNSAWENSEQVIFYYGENYLDSLLDQIWTGTDWESQQKVIYDINNAGQYQGAVVQQKAGEVWENYFSIEVTYRANQAVEDLYLLWEGGSTEPVFRVLYTHDTATPVLKRENQTSRPFPNSLRRSQVLFGSPWGEKYNLQGRRLPVPVKPSE